MNEISRYHANLGVSREEVQSCLEEDQEDHDLLSSRNHIIPRQSLWGRFNSFLLSIVGLTSTRRRVEHLESILKSLIMLNGKRVERRAFCSDVLFNALERLEELSADIDSQTHAVKGQLVADLRGVVADLRGLENRIAEGRQKDKADVAVIARSIEVERGIRQKCFTDFDRALRLSQVAVSNGDPKPASSCVRKTESPGLDSLVASFYSLLEDRYRGTRLEIQDRVGIYTNDLRKARARVGSDKFCIDLGCGRGELLQVFRNIGLKAIVGVDTNEFQLDAARASGLPVLNEEALEFLRRQESGSALAITAIHLVEHLPFDVLLDLAREIARVIDPRGVVIFETPNPRNLIVGATTFHLDPTHVKPLPAEVLTIVMEAVGFRRVEVRPLHVSPTHDHAINHESMNPHLAALLYGSQDYAIVGIMEV